MRTHSDDGMCLLGESTYEILTDSVILTEDEDEASSVHSFDGYSVEEVTSFDDSDSLHDYPSDTQEHAGIPRYGGLDELHVEVNDITVKEVCETSRQIEFDEPPCKNGQVSVVRTHVEFNEQETTQVLQHLRPESFSGRLVCTLRQTMSPELLFLDEPFRLLYVGTPSVRDEIQTKIGGALAIPAMECASSTMSTDSKSSRFNVVPVTSFGTKSSPEVELIESFGVELATDAITQAKYTKIEGQHDSISLCLNGNQWVHSSPGENGITLDASGWKLPHLAIIFCSEDDSLEMKQTRAIARIFLGRHSVATLIIANKPHYHKPTENFAVNIKGIHMCLESRGTGSGDMIHKRIPVDLATFNSLDVRQMNRNLASITGLSKAVFKDPMVSNTSKITPMDPSMQDLEKRPPAYSYDNLTQSLHWVRHRKPRDIWVAFTVGCVLCTVVAICTFSIAYLKFSRISNADITRQVSDQASSPMSITATLTSITDLSPTLRPTSKNSPTSSSKAPASCDTSASFHSLLLEPTPLTVNDSEKFKIHIIGDNNIILRPPQKYVSLRKPPPLFVEVTRNGNAIETELSKLFDGVYTIVIPREDAWGIMNVSVTTNGRNPVRELFELDFGTPWFKFTSWKSFTATQRLDLGKAVVQISSDTKRKASELGRVALQKTYEVHGIINSRLSEASTEARYLSRELTQKVSNFYQRRPSLTFPWSLELKSDYVERAQRQAVNIWNTGSSRKKQT